MFKLSSLLTSRDEEFKCNEERKIIPAFFSPCIKVNTVTKFIIYLNHCFTDSRTTAKPCSGGARVPDLTQYKCSTMKNHFISLDPIVKQLQKQSA